MAGGGRGLPESALGEWLRRFQARYEPTITRLLLLFVFVVGLIAQFV
ncbi:hypothetical protein ACFY5F_36570 [Streptomyces sp. NPDC013161]